MMTRDFQDMIYLFSCGARGIKPQIASEINIINVHKMALSQGIWSTVFLAVKQLYDVNEISIEKAIFDKWKTDILLLTISNAKRNEAVYHTIKYLENHNIKSYVLKGEAIARLYHTPICRASCDTDLLIDKENEQKASKLLKKYGYTVEKRPIGLHHINCFHPTAGHVEVHVSMYSETTDDIFLNKKVEYTEERIKIKAEGGNEIDTLGITDGLIYLTIHYIKHFINKGAGIRQLMDILLYITHYKNEINWEKFNNLLNYLKYNKLFDTLLGIGVQYLNFSKEELPTYQFDVSTADKILADIEEGGIFGHAANERAGFYSFYIKERYGTFKSGDFMEYMNEKQKKEIIEKFFPPHKIMLRHYPYIKQSRLLLPIAWLHRLIKLMLKVITKKKTISQYVKYTQLESDNEKIKKRMDLIRELDMI